MSPSDRRGIGPSGRSANTYVSKDNSNLSVGESRRIPDSKALGDVEICAPHSCFFFLLLTLVDKRIETPPYRAANNRLTESLDSHW
jgi:hypothetical protein